jgi:CzcA family heavy metal efflux pump
LKNFFHSYKNPITVLIVIIIFGGGYVYSRIQTSLFPEITFPKIKVIADAGLQPVDKMMVSVTKPLEVAIKQVPDLDVIRSTTSRGSCEISAFMNWGSDINLGQQRIESKIAEIRNNLPADVQITVARMNPSILPVMGYSLESNLRSPIELKLLANYTVKPFLSQVKGISEVRITGGKTKEYWLVLNMQRMSTLGITPETINNALTQSNFIKSNGYLSDYRYLYLTVTDATVHSLDDLRQVVVRNDGKRIVTLNDVAEVKVNDATEYIKINANGREGVLVAIVKQPNANVIDLSEKIEKRISDLKRILPSDVRVVPYYVQADFVNDSIRSVTDALWIGLLLAMIVAVIFLRSFKASATILLTIPVTISLTLLVMYAVGYTFNIMTLGAIAAAIGLIIDDAIVVVEQIHRTHEEHPDEPSTVLVQKAIHYLFPAMVGSSVSTIVIFIPFLLMSGVAGSYFSVMTNTMIIILCCSFFTTWIILPVIYLLITREKGKKTQKQIKQKEVKRQAWVSFFIRRPLISILFSAGLVVLIILLLPRLETGFLPEMDEGSIVLDYTSPAGSSLEETDNELKEIDKILKKIPEVQAYSRRTGTQMGFFITEPNSGDYLIQLKKKRNRTTEEVIEDTRGRIETSLPQLRVDFGQVIGDMLGDLMTSVQPIEIKIFGDNQELLHRYSKEVAKIISEVKGTADVFNGIVIAGPSVTVQPQYEKLSRFGLTPASFQYQLQTALEGNVVGAFFEKEQYSNIRQVYPGNRKLSLNEMSNQQVFLPDGRLKPISEFAQIQVTSGQSEIQRENLQSMGVVTGRLENRDLGSTIKDIRIAIQKNLKLPTGYHIEYGGAYAEQQKSFNELLMILITSSLLVFSVILFLYKDFRIALLILLIGLLGIAGSYLALFITRTPLNVGSYTGLIMIVGIIAENAIFTFLQYRESLHEKSVDDSIIYAISTRLRPKLMTALGAIIALLPLALGIGSGAKLHQPLAIAVIGGFIVAIPLLLIVLPTGIRLISRRE